MGLGFLPGLTPSSVDPFAVNATRAFAANVDGSIIVGAAQSATSSTAWRWTATSGMQDLNLIATNAGLNLNGFVLTDAVGISDNGQFIAGNAFNTAQTQTLGYVLQLAQITRTQLIVRVTLPGVTLQSLVNQSFNTRVDGTLNGVSLFTRSIADTIDSAAGVTALADARTALQQQTGLRRIVIGAPTLVSNTTTVLSTTNSTVNVAGASSVSTATINSFGPATVITGDLGICATGVVGSTAPTGCSQAGTPVTVDPGILNSNIYTTTQESVTPTTTPTVNQRIDAVWRVADTAGNRFGTAHGLVGPAAFERGDRFLMQMVGQGGSDEAQSAVARASAPMKQGLALGGADSGLSMFGGYYNVSSRTDADAALAVAAVRGKSDGFVLGLEKSLGDGRIGLAVDHGTSDYAVRDAAFPESLDLKQTQIGLYGGWQGGRVSLSGAASYGFGTVRTSVASPTGPAIAGRKANSWSAGAQAGYAVPLGKAASVNLVAGVRHSSVDLNRFTEVGGNAPLAGIAGKTDRTRLYAGAEAEFKIESGATTLTPRLHARYAHDSGDASGRATVAFASSPNGPTYDAIGPSVGGNIAELGGSIEVSVSDSVGIWAGYDGQFRSAAKSHAVKAGVRIAF
jgi:hypothetical protein